MTTYDVVVIGAGTAGAAVAARLSADPSCRVALVEAGPDYAAADTPAALRGGNFLRAVAVGRLRWPDTTARLTRAHQPRTYIRGRGVGGSSAINGQSAIRGLPGDFDRWAAQGCAGWSWSEVLPAFQDLEDDLDFGGPPHHGRGGPVPVSRVPRHGWGASSRALADAAIRLGHPAQPDINAPGACGVSPFAWNRRDGARASTKDSYVEPARDRANLTVLPDALATRLRFHGSRLTGVDLVTGSDPVTLAARHAVVCAGAIGSPALLLRSGIGPAGELGALGIPVVADLPGVGRNLQDHPTIWMVYPLAEAARLARADALPGHCALRLSSGVRDGADDLQLYACDYAGSRSSGALMVALLDPVSTGRVRLRSADPAVEPDIALNMLADPGDVVRLAAGFREAVRMLAHPAFAPVLAGPARLPAGERADEVADSDLAGVLRAGCTSYNHATGTCRMGAPGDPRTVVDPSGSVLGVEGVSVADASVMPRIVRAPTNLTTVMLAERLAASIRAELLEHAAQQL